MSNAFKVLFLTFKKAQLKYREEVCLSQEEASKLIDLAKDALGIQEIFIISTCNRTEIYYLSDQTSFKEELLKLLAVVKGISSDKESFRYFEEENDSIKAIKRLYFVAMGLESQVLGDLQIINQVKQAYQLSADKGVASHFLHRLLHGIFYANKKVVQETEFRDGVASLSYATVELVDKIVNSNFNEPILLVGLGEMGTDVCDILSNFGYSNVTLANRTEEKAIFLASKYNFKHLAFESLIQMVAEASIIISTVGNQSPIISKKHFESQDVLTFKHLIDLSVPRSIDPEVEELPGINLYNIDELNEKANITLAKRKESIPQVIEIIEQSFEEFNDWSKEIIASPVINKLKNALEEIRQEELSRYIKQLDVEQLKLIESLTKNMMQKIIKIPAIQLKAACKRGDADNLIDVLNSIFDLEKKSSFVLE